MIRQIQIGGYNFKSYVEFKALIDLAVLQGFKTVEEFNKFLKLHFSK